MNVRRLLVRGRPAVARVLVAETLVERMRGLLGRSGLLPGEAMLIVPCGSIHTLFMRFAIDVVFLDRNQRVTRCVRRLRPWRLALGGRGAHAVLELPAGWLETFPLERGEGVEWVVV